MPWKKLQLRWEARALVQRCGVLRLRFFPFFRFNARPDDYNPNFDSSIVGWSSSELAIHLGIGRTFVLPTEIALMEYAAAEG